MKNLTRKSLWAVAVIVLLPSFASAERPSREDRQAERENLFVAADDDESGGLSAAELEVFVSLTEASRSESRFNRADADENGELSLEELTKMNRKKHRLQRQR
jgi:Ca2+-binding EF-hand superfamily protein